MQTVHEAIETYHQLLHEDNLLWDTYEQLQNSQKERGLYFGDRYLCNVLRPHFYWVESWAFLKKQTELILSAFKKAHQACMDNPHYRQQLGLHPYEEELHQLDKAIAAPCWTSSRLDAFFKSDSFQLKFVEYNAETPAGIGYGDELSEAFSNLEIFKRFEKKFHIAESFQGQVELTQALLNGYKQWGGTDTPQIAIVDWDNVPTRSEHIIAREYFDRQGIKAILADPRYVEYRNGKLYHEDFRIDLIYKRVLITELLERLGTESEIVKAVKDRAVMMTNSFSAKLMAKKASFAFLSDENNSNLFTLAEWQAINQHIPWTRVVSDRKTFFYGREVDLLTYITDNRHKFVLKPNDDYGGAGVLLGWEAADEEWDNILKIAVDGEHIYVVQERVEPVYRDFPAIIDGKLDISTRFVDADPYIFNGEYVSGCLTRLSSAALLNVTAGKGSVVPTFVIEKAN